MTISGNLLHALYKTVSYNVFLLLLSQAPQLSQDVLVIAGSLCDEAAKLSAVIKERPCT
jgi:hypothetical protein